MSASARTTRSLDELKGIEKIILTPFEDSINIKSASLGPGLVDAGKGKDKLFFPALKSASVTFIGPSQDDGAVLLLRIGSKSVKFNSIEVLTFTRGNDVFIPMSAPTDIVLDGSVGIDTIDFTAASLANGVILDVNTSVQSSPTSIQAAGFEVLIGSNLNDKFNIGAPINKVDGGVGSNDVLSFASCNV